MEEKKLYLEDLENWMRSHCDPIDKLISVMAKINLPKDYMINFKRAIDNQSYCSLEIKDKKIGIHVGMYDFLVNHEKDDSIFDDEAIEELQKDHDRIIGNLGREFTENDFYAIYMASAVHEFMHACITRCEDVLERIVKKFPMNKKNPTQIEKKIYEDYVRKFIMQIFNCVEDARIENIAKNLYNVDNELNYLNEMFYLQDDGTFETNVISEFTISLKYNGVLGVFPQTPIDDEAHEAIMAILEKKVNGSARTRNLLQEFMCEAGPRESVCMFERWFVPEWQDLPAGQNKNKFYEYVYKLIHEELEKDANDISQQIQNFLNGVQSPVNISGGNGGKGKGNPNGILINIPSSFAAMIPDFDPDGSQSNGSNGGGTSGSKSSGSSNGASAQGKHSQNGSGSKNKNTCSGNGGTSEGKDDDDGANTTSSTNNNGNEQDGEDKTNKSESSSNDNGNQKDGTDASSADSSDDNGENEGDTNENEAANTASHSSSGSGDMESQQHSTFDKNGKWNTSDPNLKASGTAKKLAEIDAIRKELDRTIERIKKKVSKTQPKPNKGRQSREKIQKTVESGDWIIDRSFKATRKAPKNIVTMAQPLRKAIRKFFHDSEEDDIRNLRSGNLDDNALYKYMGLGETEIFEKHIEDESKDSVYYILWDGSGSMYGEKQTKSGIACAVIEEAIKGLFPLKIVNFSHDYRVGSTHYIVKEFSDKSKYNAAYSFAAARSFSGSNRDSDAIDMATRELAARSESKKYMFVLSDGAPSAYCGGSDEGIIAVKEAVAKARNQHINVISIFFGTDRELLDEIDHYRTMYGNSVIACSPEQIAGQLIGEIKKTIF